MDIKNLDLNLLKLFDAVYRLGNVSRAAEALELSQPAVSQAVARLRLLLRDPLFVRAPGGVKPTVRAERLARGVQAALAAIDQAVNEPDRFTPQLSQRIFRLHMSDIGEGRFLPELMVAAREQAPGVRIETLPVAMLDIADALDAGRIDLAVGFLPQVRETRHAELFDDSYVVLMREGHPFLQRGAQRRVALDDLDSLEFISVRTHTATLRILQLLGLEGRLRLTTEHFLGMPAIVRATDLCGVIPRNTARSFAEAGGCAIIEPSFPLRDFSVSVHWSPRFENDAGNRWLRHVMIELFASSGAQR